MLCENCNNQHNEIFGSGRFCDIKCARAFSTKNNRKETALKISKALRIFHPETKPCPVCGKFFTEKKKSSKTCSLSCGGTLRYRDPVQRKITSEGTIGKTGGWRNFGGNGKKGIYEGYLYQSSWELIWIKFHLDRKIPFRRCTEYFEYEFEGKIRKYFPDFYLENTKEYVEVKGFPSPKTDSKIESVKRKGFKISVVGKNEIRELNASVA